MYQKTNIYIRPSLIVKAIILCARVIIYYIITYCVIHTNIPTQTNVLYYV